MRKVVYEFTIFICIYKILKGNSFSPIKNVYEEH